MGKTCFAGPPCPPPGFTLVEVMIGLALAALLALALMSLGNLSSRVSRTTYLTESASTAQDLVRMILRSRANCTAVFQPMGIRYTPNAKGGLTPITQELRYTVKGQTIVLVPQQGSTTPDGLTVKSVTLADVPLPVPQPGYYTANLSIQFERYDPTKPTSPSNRPNTSYGSPYASVTQIPLAITTDSSGVILGCAGVPSSYGGTYTTYAQCDQGQNANLPCPPGYMPPNKGTCKTPNQDTNSCSCPSGYQPYRTLDLTMICWKAPAIASQTYYEGGQAPWPPQRPTNSAAPPVCGYYQYQCLP